MLGLPLGFYSGFTPVRARHLQLIFPSIFRHSNSTSIAFSLHFFHGAATQTTCLTVPPLDVPSSRAHSNLLHLCSSLQSLHQTKQTHALALVQGLIPPSVSLCSALILSYATHGGSANTCHVLFEATVPYCRNAFLWNNLLRAHSILGVCDGFATYNGLFRSGVLPDDHTFPSALKVCADFAVVRKGREVHGTVIKLGFTKDLYVGNTLLLFYSKCGDLDGAGEVFEEMPQREVVTWNTMVNAYSVQDWLLEALNLFVVMNSKSGLMPNVVTVVSVLPVCAELEDELMIRLVHGYVIRTGLAKYVTVCNALIDAYAKSSNVKSSRQVFDEITERNAVSWNAAITGFAHVKRYDDAFSMFRTMISSGEKPNVVTISSMLPVLVELGKFNAGKEIHAFSIRLGLDSDLFIANSLLDMYAKFGHPTLASNVFHNIDKRNAVSWNAMVASLAQNGAELAAMALVLEMQAQGFAPNAVTFTNILPTCGRVGAIRSGREIHARSIRFGFVSDLFLSNSIIDMYAKCGCLKTAHSVFDLSFKDQVSYNTLIVNYSQTENSASSLNLFREMGLNGLERDIVSVVGAVAACTNLSALKKGKEIHCHAMRKLLHGCLFVANSLLDLYTKCGRIDSAQIVFDSIHKKDAASWNTMIMGFGMLGQFEKAIELFEVMKKEHMTCDSVSYIAVLSACGHGGLVEKGKRYFDEMRSNIEPSTMHFAIMVDLLGRAGLVHEAVDLIKNLPVELDAHIWAALLGVSRVNGDINLALWAAGYLFELRPEHCGYYAQVSNMLCEAGRWEEARRVRELMKSRGVKKNPGCSWVQSRDEVHTFLSGTFIDRLHSGVCIVESG